LLEAKWKIKSLVVVNLFAVILFVSFLNEPMSSFWYELDSSLFWSFNNSLAWGETWQTIWGIANNRAFDIVAVGTIIIPFLYYGHKKENWKLSRTISILIFIALVAVTSLLIAKKIPIQRASPTIHFPDSAKITELVSFSTKDSSSDSFPGDHGIGLMIFAGFAFYYLSTSYGIVVSFLAVFFTFPRVMVGAHWVSDELVGAISFGLIALSIVFYTPLHSIVLSKIESIVESIINRIKNKV